MFHYTLACPSIVSFPPIYESSSAWMRSVIVTVSSDTTMSSSTSPDTSLSTAVDDELYVVAGFLHSSVAQATTNAAIAAFVPFSSPMTALARGFMGKRLNVESALVGAVRRKASPARDAGDFFGRYKRPRTSDMRDRGRAESIWVGMDCGVTADLKIGTAMDGCSINNNQHGVCKSFTHHILTERFCERWGGSTQICRHLYVQHIVSYHRLQIHSLGDIAKQCIDECTDSDSVECHLHARASCRLNWTLRRWTLEECWSFRLNL